MARYNLPPAYPDELWYSRVVRYHRRSSNIHQKDTIQELNQSNIKAVSTPELPVYLPGTTMISYYQNGNKMEDFRETVIKETLTPFVFRSYGFDKQIKSLEPEFIKKNLGGKIRGRNTDYLQYCPMCYQEDIKRYGESYWHRVHQLPHIKACSKHKCKLLSTGLRIGVVKRIWACADETTCKESLTVPATKEELLFAGYLEYFLNAPYACPETYSQLNFSQIEQTLKEMQLVENHYDRTIDVETLRSSCISKFGESFFEEVFPDCFSQKYLCDMLEGFVDRNTRDTAQYAFLCAYLELSPETTLKECDTTSEVTNTLSNSLCLSTKKSKENCRIPVNLTPKRQKQMLSFTISPEMMKAIRIRARTSGEGSIASYVRYCIYQDLKNSQ